MHVLTIGGTGMLLGATKWLLKQGHTVSVVSRRAEQVCRGDWAVNTHPISVDYRHTQELRGRISQALSLYGPVELAVLWIHSDAPDAFSVIADEVSRAATAPWRLFHVRGSMAHVHPESPSVPLNCRYRQVILGFVRETGTSRWLTHEEISDGLVRAITADCERLIVGALEPWADRPV
ncbi:MAG: short-chain dehydrogenase [Alicyclobacillus sp.]|nr:short-chain dehydrogenase [Alicyclobacillus sp.]